METKPDYITDPENQNLEPPIEIIPESSRLVMEHKPGFSERRKRTWIKLSVTFLEVMKELKGCRLSVFLCIGLHVNRKGESFPSIKLMAEETGYSVRQIKTAIQELEDKGYLTVTRNHRKVNLYSDFGGFAYGNGNEPESLSAGIAPKSRTAVSKDARNCTQENENVLEIAPQVEPVLKEEPLINGAGDFSNETDEQLLGELVIDESIPDDEQYSDNSEYIARMAKAIQAHAERREQDPDKPDVSFLPERTRPLTLAFLQALYEDDPARMRRHVPTEKTKKHWIKTVDEWLEFGASWREVKNAVAYMVEQGLTISGPQSATGCIRDLRAPGQEKPKANEPVYRKASDFLAELEQQ